MSPLAFPIRRWPTGPRGSSTSSGSRNRRHDPHYHKKRRFVVQPQGRTIGLWRRISTRRFLAWAAMLAAVGEVSLFGTTGKSFPRPLLDMDFTPPTVVSHWATALARRSESSRL